MFYFLSSILPAHPVACLYGTTSPFLRIPQKIHRGQKQEREAKTTENCFLLIKHVNIWVCSACSTSTKDCTSLLHHEKVGGGGDSLFQNLYFPTFHLLCNDGGDLLSTNV